MPIDGVLWKIDVTIITKEFDKSKELTERFKSLLDKAGESKRIAILEIKEAMRQGKKYKNGVDGKLIYKAVLENGITTSEEFEEFIKNVK